MDTHSFTAGADYRVYASTRTELSRCPGDSWGNVFASEGTTLEYGDTGARAVVSVREIAGMGLPTAEPYFVRMGGPSNVASLRGTICRYDFYLRVLSGSPIPETEPSDEDAPEATRSSGWRSRVIGLATAKTGNFAITVNGRDTIGVIVAVDLERGAPGWDLMAGAGVFTGSFIIAF